MCEIYVYDNTGDELTLSQVLCIVWIHNYILIRKFYWQLLFSIVVGTITHLTISCHYTSSKAAFSFCHLAFVSLDDYVRLHRILTSWLKVFISKYVNFLCYMPHNVMTDYNTKSGNIGSHFESQDGLQVLNNTRLNNI